MIWSCVLLICSSGIERKLVQHFIVELSLFKIRKRA